MKKNGEFVGVDDKFIPENEKYVDDSILGNKEESERKVKKVVKGLSIGYLCLIGFVVLMSVAMIIFTITMSFKMFNKNSELINTVEGQFQESEYDKQLAEAKKQNFNRTFEIKIGTKNNISIGWLLDDIVTNNKTNSEHILAVTYNDTTTTEPDNIVEIKHLLEDNKKYEVSLDYDTEGYINKVIIKDI